MSNDTAKLLEACVEYRAKLDKLEGENAELRAHAERVGEANDRLAFENDALRAKIAELEHFLSPKL